MVRLKATQRHYRVDPVQCFNSKMVRLKGILATSGNTGDFTFQFQNGAIKRIGVIEGQFTGKGFQFQNGAIKSTRHVFTCNRL